MILCSFYDMTGIFLKWIQFNLTYFVGMHLQQSSISKSLPNSSPSSSVCGKRWCSVSGNRKPVIPPKIDMNPITTSGRRRLSVPFKTNVFSELENIENIEIDNFQTILLGQDSLYENLQILFS